MLRLAELVGELHYLRGLCAAPEASAWRDRMGDLLAGEAADEGRRLALTQAFNKGYAAVRPRYSRCDAGAKAMTRAALEEGRGLATSLASEAGG